MPSFEHNSAVPAVIVGRAIVWDKDDVVGHGGKFLFLERPGHKKHDWECPGGTVEIGETVRSARKHETHEESGLEVVRIHPLDFVSEKIMSDNGLLHIALFSLSKVTGGTFERSNEHVNEVWLGYNAALDLRLTAESRDALVHFGPVIRQLAGFPDVPML